MLVRAILVLALVSGCSAGTPSLADPGKSARDVIAGAIRRQAPALGITASQAECLVGYINRTMSDQEIQRMDAALSTGASDRTADEVIKNGIASCTR